MAALAIWHGLEASVGTDKSQPAFSDADTSEGELTHVNEQGRARMVDVSGKARTHRTATAAGKVRMSPKTVELVRTGGSRKGDVLAVAQVAGIMAAKHCSDLIPMCHPIALTDVDVHFSLESDGVAIEATCGCVGETGVEMEALTAVSVAGLTVYDMLKSHERGMVIEEVRLLEKDGGRSGHYVAPAAAAVDGPVAAAPEPVPAAAGAPVAEPEPVAAGAPAPELAVVAAATPAMPAGVVEAVSISEKRGVSKHPVECVELLVGTGVVGDAHAGEWHRQVSLLPAEALESMAAEVPGLGPGSFAENILVRGLDLKKLSIGTTLQLGTAEVVLTQIGKECHVECEIRRLTGHCVMPDEGVFGVVTRSGMVRAGDVVRVKGDGA